MHPTIHHTQSIPVRKSAHATLEHFQKVDHADVGSLLDSGLFDHNFGNNPNISGVLSDKEGSRESCFHLEIWGGVR